MPIGGKYLTTNNNNLSTLPNSWLGNVIWTIRALGRERTSTNGTATTNMVIRIVNSDSVSGIQSGSLPELGKTAHKKNFHQRQQLFNTTVWWSDSVHIQNQIQQVILLRQLRKFHHSPISTFWVFLLTHTARQTDRLKCMTFLAEVKMADCQLQFRSTLHSH